MQKRTRGNAKEKKAQHGWEKQWNKYADGFGQKRKMRREWAEYKRLKKTPPLDLDEETEYIEPSSNGDTMSIKMKYNRVYEKLSNGDAIVQVYQDHYVKEYPYLMELVRVLTGDFSTLERKDIVFGIYSGKRNKGQMFVEAIVPVAQIPASYIDVGSVEPNA